MRRLFPLFAACLIALPLIAHGARAEDSGGSDDKAQPKHKVTQSATFVMIEPMYATIIDAGRPSGLLMVAVGLDIPDAELRGEAEHALPLLRDAYLRYLMAFTATAVRPWRQPDVVEIAGRMQRITDRTLKRKGARLLLAQVAIQPPH